MTLNTAAGLAAASAVHMPVAVSVYPKFGDPDQAWLQSAGWGYPGVLAISTTAPEVAIEDEHFVYRRRRRLRTKKLTLGV